MYDKCLEKKCREIVESKLEDGQCGFRPGRSTMDQIFTLKQIFEKSWENGKDVFACFVDLEKAYNRVPRDKLWMVFCRIMPLMVNCCLPFYCLSTTNQKSVFVSMVSNQSHSMWALVSGKGAFYFLFFSYFT